jgi:6-phosphogluconolactonase
MKNFELISFASADELAQTVAGAWLDEIESANRAGKPHRVALSGGRIARKFFVAAVKQTKARKIGDGDPGFAGGYAEAGTPSLPVNVHFFWADERCVPPDDKESNFRLANELLFVPLKIPENQIHRIHGELPPDKAAELATEEIQRVVPTAFLNSNSNPPAPTLSPVGRREEVNLQPVLDLIFLGMGEDGHVASLFPNASAEIENSARPFLAVENSPKPPLKRISMSYAAIAAAKNIWVLVSGTGKEAALRESLAQNGQTPLAQVIHSRLHTKIFTDFQVGR